MIKLVNLTTIRIQETTYDDNKDIIWPTIVGIFVALALGWMICRYKCSSEERSPHIVQCCPKSFCKRIRLCFIWIFSLCRFKNEPPPSQQQTSPSSQIRMNKGRSSSCSILEIPFNSNSIVTSPKQQWPLPFILNNSERVSNPLLNTSQPKRHPSRRESLLPVIGNINGKRDSISWPFQTTNMFLHKQTNEIKTNSLFFNT